MKPEMFREELKGTCERLGREVPEIRFKDQPGRKPIAFTEGRIDDRPRRRWGSGKGGLAACRTCLRRPSLRGGAAGIPLN